jgi:Icc-related predicted phosphoesterase
MRIFVDLLCFCGDLTRKSVTEQAKKTNNKKKINEDMQTTALALCFFSLSVVEQCPKKKTPPPLLPPTSPEWNLNTHPLAYGVRVQHPRVSALITWFRVVPE